ncbi:MAG: hypothetical protein ACXIT9_12825 [Nitritalea sp.]
MNFFPKLYFGWFGLYEAGSTSVNMFKVSVTWVVVYLVLIA